jgi:hypothetical protein
MGTPAKVRSLGENGSPYGFTMGARRARRAGGLFGGELVRLIAPTGDDPAETRWAEIPSGAPITVATPVRRQRGVIQQAVEIASYGEELVRLVLHPESKMLGPHETVCKAGTKGRLTPGPVPVAAVHLVGKEGNRLEEVATGEVTDPDEVLIDYGDDAWEQLSLAVGRAMGIRRLARETGFDRSHLLRYSTCARCRGQRCKLPSRSALQSGPCRKPDHRPLRTRWLCSRITLWSIPKSEVGRRDDVPVSSSTWSYTSSWMVAADAARQN